MKGKLKLYKVTLRGMTYSSTGVVHGISYVVAEDPTEAYTKVRSSLDQRDIGYSADRELDTIELLAGEYVHNDTKTILYL